MVPHASDRIKSHAPGGAGDGDTLAMVRFSSGIGSQRDRRASTSRLCRMSASDFANSTSGEFESNITVGRCPTLGENAYPAHRLGDWLTHPVSDTRDEEFRAIIFHSQSMSALDVGVTEICGGFSPFSP